ncbi:hypothetical protein QFZ44_004087 [Pantoea agglomerans]|nr:hypothetical protein [Pantoea agglomerans]
MMPEEKKSPVTFTKNDVEIIARETVYDGFFFRRTLSLPPPPV